MFSGTINYLSILLELTISSSFHKNLNFKDWIVGVEPTCTANFVRIKVRDFPFKLPLSVNDETSSD